MCFSLSMTAIKCTPRDFLQCNGMQLYSPSTFPNDLAAIYIFQKLHFPPIINFCSLHIQDFIFAAHIYLYICIFSLRGKAIRVLLSTWQFNSALLCNTQLTCLTILRVIIDWSWLPDMYIDIDTYTTHILSYMYGATLFLPIRHVFQLIGIQNFHSER